VAVAAHRPVRPDRSHRHGRDAGARSRHSIGFAVADGRGKIIAVETAVAGGFVVLAAAGVTGPGWLLVVGFIGHGFKDLWQHRRHYVANTRWWPPFCLVVDWVAAAVLVVLITVGVPFHP
jgi:hypothetical protein